MLIQKSKNVLKIMTENDFNVSGAESVKKQILKALEKLSKQEVMLVFSECDVLDEAGLKLVIGLYQHCLNKEVKLTLLVNNPNILETMHLCHIDQFIDVKESSK